MQGRYVQRNTVQKAWLYSLVFDRVVVRYIVACMFMFFIMHPATPAFASEDIPAEIVTDPNNDPAIDPEPEVEVETVTPSEGVFLVPEEDSAPLENEKGVSEKISEDMEASFITQDEVTINEADNSIDTSENQEDLNGDEIVDEVIPSEEEVLTDGGEDTDVDVSSPTGDVQEAEVETPVVEEVSSSSGGSSSGSSGKADDALDENDPQEEKTDQQQTETDTDITAGTNLEELSKLLATTTNASQSDGLSGEVAGIASSTKENEVPEESFSETDTTSTTTQDAESTSESNDDDSATTAEEEFQDLFPETELNTIVTGTSTSSTTVAVPEESFVATDLSAHQFSDAECINVGDGSFYCSQNESAPEYIEDRVFSAPDSDGDMEIYVTIEGKTTQITHNLFDDASPYYDGTSNTIVWHSMQNSRFQIAQYDVDTGEVSYLTNETYNNMEPVAHGEVVMWQAWIGNNWEIMLLSDNELTQLTDNDMHDITPQMRDGYIMWQTQFAEGWKVALYDLKTEKVQYIADSDGSKIANPRFVLVYDSTDKIGDKRTVGYDFGSGSSFTLGYLPAEMPEEIPEPDQTGETRALIQTKPSTREGETEEIQPVPNGSNGTTTPASSATSTPTDNIPEADNGTEDLIIQSVVAVATSTEDTSEATPTPDEIVDMHVEDAISSSGEDISHIDEVVIPPFVGTTTQEVG